MSFCSEKNYDASSFILSQDDYEDNNGKLSESENENENYPYVCPKCYSIPIIDIDFQNNKYNIICDNGHAYNYNSFNTFEVNTTKNLNNLLCQKCKKDSNNKANLYRCNNCFLYFCNDCKLKHETEKPHSNFCELKDINNYSDNNLSYSAKNISEFEIDSFKEKYKQYDNFKRTLKENIDQLLIKINNYFSVFDNFFLLYNKIIDYSKNNKDIYQNNFNSYLNFEILYNNEKKVNKYFKNVYYEININNDFKIENTLDFIKVLFDFDKERIFSIDYKRKKEEILQQNESNLQESRKKRRKQKQLIDELKNMKILLNCEANTEVNEDKNHENDSQKNYEIKCFSPLNSEKNIVLGKKNGEIEILEIPENQDSFFEKEIFKLKLNFKLFENEIKYICELDDDLIAVSDGKYSIKIIKLEENISKYSIIQTINLAEYNIELIYCMIYLPIYSTFKKTHYFCIADDLHIFIFKSNKQPKNIINLKNETNENNDEPLKFSLYKDIKLKTLSHCLIEAYGKYLIAACPKKNCIKFFDLRKDFKEVSEISKLEITNGSNTLALTPKNNLLIVACKNGFSYISIDRRAIYKTIHCIYSVFCLEIFNENTFICCCSDKKGKKIKQIKISEVQKCAEIQISNNEEIWKLQKINDRIIFLNSQNCVNYLT